MPTTPLCLEHLTQAASDARRAEREIRTVLGEPADGRIYYLQVGSRIKIGWTSDMSQRMRAYPPDSVLLAVEQGSLADERDMHRTCRPYRTHGREWYEPCEAMYRFVEEAKDRERKRLAEVTSAPATRDMPVTTLDGTMGWNEHKKRSSAPAIHSGTHGNVGR